MKRLRLLALSPALLVAQCAPECAPAPAEEPAAVEVAWEAGNCASFAEEAAAADLPWGIFSPIAWRETGCNPWAWVVDSDDTGGAMFGLNFKGSLATHWFNLCGATVNNIRGNVPLQMECASKQYHRYGLSAWRT